MPRALSYVPRDTLYGSSYCSKFWNWEDHQQQVSALQGPTAAIHLYIIALTWVFNLVFGKESPNPNPESILYALRYSIHYLVRVRETARSEQKR